MGLAEACWDGHVNGLVEGKGLDVEDVLVEGFPLGVRLPQSVGQCQCDVEVFQAVLRGGFTERQVGQYRNDFQVDSNFEVSQGLCQLPGCGSEIDRQLVEWAKLAPVLRVV